MIMLNKVDLHGVLDASDVSFPLFLSYMLLPHIHAKVGQRSLALAFSISLFLCLPE